MRYAHVMHSHLCTHYAHCYALPPSPPRQPHVSLANEWRMRSGVPHEAHEVGYEVGVKFEFFEVSELTTLRVLPCFSPAPGIIRPPMTACRRLSHVKGTSGRENRLSP